MDTEKTALISGIRSASRDLVREFGLMNKTVAGTGYSLSAVHAIIEIGHSQHMTSKALSEKLLLEKSTVSRLVKSLVDRGEIREQRTNHDLRMKFLHLTERGRETLRGIDHYAVEQVSNALKLLDENTGRVVLSGLQSYASALGAASGHGEQVPCHKPVRIQSGYCVAILGRIIGMLLPHMHQYYDFGAEFESRVAADIAEFMTRLGSTRNQTWYAELNGQVVGSISIDGEDLGRGLAHLRWFVVDGAVRGSGVGRKLLSHALEFCDQNAFSETHLWTVKGLDAARKLYEQTGFELVEEYYGDQWGSRVLEQKFVRKLVDSRDI